MVADVVGEKGCWYWGGGVVMIESSFTSRKESRFLEEEESKFDDDEL